MLYVRYVRSLHTLRSSRSTSYDLGYHSSSHSSIGSILDRAYINQLASSNSSLSSCNIVLKASIILKEIDDDLEAAAEAIKEEVEGWKYY